MRKPVRIVLLVLLVLVLLAGGGMVAIWWASRHVPDWYREATESVDSEKQREASDQMLQRVADLASGLKKTGRWNVTFTAEQINGWMAVDLAQNHPNLLPPGLSDPRVVIEQDGITVACRASHGDLSSVVSLKVDVYLAEPNVIAMRIRRARAGRLPWPLATILDGTAEAARQHSLPLTWRRADGDPVALFTIPPVHDEDGKLVRIEALQLGDGEVYLAGTTEEQPED